MTKKIQHSLFLILSVFVVMACKKEPDSPPVKSLGNNQVLTIDSLKSWQRSIGEAIVIEDDLSVYGIVTMNEGNGNIYKNIYLQDHTGAINVRFTSGTDLIQGDSIRIGLKGVTLNNFNGVYQLDNVDEKINVVVQARDINFTPQIVTINEVESAYASFLSDPEIVDFNFQSTLVQFNNVQYKTSELSKTYADAINQASANRYFADFVGNSSFIRTSGFADFAGDSLPKGSGTLICIVSEYNGELQYILRSPEESTLINDRGPGEILIKDFDDNNILSGGWSIQQVIGMDSWEIGTAGTWVDRPYAVITNYDGTNHATESWLISPTINLASSVAASLSFDNAYKYSGDPLKVMVSVDYTGTGDPNLSTWVEMTAIWSGGDFAFVNSGPIDLSAYLASNVHIAFKYSGSASSGRTWEIDNIIING